MQKVELWKTVGGVVVAERRFIAIMTLIALAIGFTGMVVVNTAIAQQLQPQAEAPPIVANIDVIAIAATAIAGIIGAVVAIGSMVVEHVRRVTGNKIITDSANSALQEVFRNGRLTDEWIREFIVDLHENKARIAAITDATKALLGPEKAGQIDEAMINAEKAMREEIIPKLEIIDRELDTIYKNMPAVKSPEG